VKLDGVELSQTQAKWSLSNKSNRVRLVSTDVKYSFINFTSGVSDPTNSVDGRMHVLKGVGFCGRMLTVTGGLPWDGEALFPWDVTAAPDLARY
jgi:hypothetical protein